MTNGPDARPLRVAMVMNQVLGWSQNFITRELVQLIAEGVDLHVGSRRVETRADLSAEETAVAARLWYLPENPFAPRWLLRQVRCVLTRPLRYLRAWGHLLSLPHASVG